MSRTPIIRLSQDTVALTIQGDGRKVVVTIPAGSEVAALGPIPLELIEDRAERIDVLWDGKTVSTFLVDLQERGERVRSAAGLDQKS